jgi:hypothetical protein
VIGDKIKFSTLHLMALVHNAGQLKFGAKGKGKNWKRAFLNN